MRPILFATRIRYRLAGLALIGIVVIGLAIAWQLRWNQPSAADPAMVPDVAAAQAGDPAVPNDPGVYSEFVLFGQTAAFSGPARGLGIEMRRGILAAFAEANAAGGIAGRRLRLKSLDDYYEPEAAIANAQSLIRNSAVFALIGSVGTPTSRSTVPVAAETGVPFIAPFTGAGFLRNPDLGIVINLRASYDQETEAMVQQLVGVKGYTRVGVLYQDDSFGRAGYNGVRAALDRRGMAAVGVGLYTRNTTAVKTALLDLAAAAPEAIIAVGAYEPVGSLIALAKATGLDSEFVAISFVGSNSLAEHLGPQGVGVQVTQVVPFPTDPALPITAQYLAALAEHDPAATPGFVSFEGYLAGRLAIAGLEMCGAALDRNCFLERLRASSRIQLGGFELSFGENDNQGSDRVFLTVIGSDGQFAPVEG